MFKKWKYFQLSKVGRINQQIFFIIIGTITIPLLIISVVLFITAAKVVKTEHESSSHLILTNLSSNIDQYLQSIEKGTITSLMDINLQLALEQWPNTQFDNAEDLQLKYENVIENFVGSIEMSIKNVDSVQIYTGNRVFYSANFNRADYNIGHFTDEEWYKRTLEAKGQIVLFGTHKPFHRVDALDSVISIARVINKSGTKKALSVILVDIRLDSLREILSKSEITNRKFLILDEDNQLIYASDPTMVDENLLAITEKLEQVDYTNLDAGHFYASIQNVKSYVNYVDSSYSGWKVVQYISEYEMIKYAKNIQNIIFALALLSLATALLFLFILYKRVTQPIIRLSRQVKLVGSGNFNLKLDSKRNDEFGVLYNGISKMVADLNLYIERLSDAKVQQKMTQYGALKSQINPHFLANTLETIQMKVIINGDRETAEMIGIVGHLFRSFIPTGKETLTLQEELQQIRLYIKVQQLRFGDKIEYEENLVTGSDQAIILHFILQPLVENAIVHGLERKVGKGKVEVSTAITSKQLLILIKDNGVGMTAKQIAQLQSKLDTPVDMVAEEHIGVKNVHDRIRYYYGDPYGITIESQENEGTTITLYFPMKNE
ncbi:sensor histidine kinase [Paenibacillus endoradicis]|uniref:sensor histidine kinase n=1 Tax=Paenibacillus endoradicis TaxID=2972487 RepID=UPI00215976C9|nr:sensor histidine kinase [Paenibacillus endoradicis]MCR8660204.1 histidine kinase [Paenibacillus endoradicis]